MYMTIWNAKRAAQDFQDSLILSKPPKDIEIDLTILWKVWFLLG